MALKLDARDIQILSLLQERGRISKSELAKLVRLSPSPCWERLRRLESAGLITGYYARVDLQGLTQVTEVLVEITLANHTQEAFQAFENYIATIEEIRSCWATGGGIDYILAITTPGIEDYQRLVDQLLKADVGVLRYFTYVVTKKVKDVPGLPLKRFLHP